MKVAFPTNEGEKIARHASFCQSFLIIDTKTGEREVVDNPLKTEAAATGVEKDKSGGRHLGSGPIISALLADAGVDIYAYLEAEANFLLHLQREGIDLYETQEKVIETALETVEAKGSEIQKSRFFGLGRGRGMGRGFGRRAGKGRDFGRGFGRGMGRGFGNR
ncbi:MAG: NifB/NifX family molybdenum-iron cluster-binding protein [Campylobacterota bacterium]|nr:NifB/NifX family molybdenum-iron cluster-binding protein [Campylobacterota bacterium]